MSTSKIGALAGGPRERVRRLADLDWAALEAGLNENGYAVLTSLLDDEECKRLTQCYADGPMFRSRVVMEQHGFGRGEYRYFDYPLPEPVASLRSGLYSPLARIANRWSTLLGESSPFPPTHTGLLRQCHEAGQTRPTPLLLQYTAGDYNCLHQDLYGDIVFPLQLTVLLSDPVKDFRGGEFVLTEQRPRMQSRASVVPLDRGDAVVFPVRYRPVKGTRGIYRVNMRHGVSQVRSGSRHTLGVIFHDAR